MAVMPRPRKPYVQKETTRHGRTVWYFRKGEGKRIRLRAEYESTEWLADYEAALGIANGEGPPPRAAKGTLGWAHRSVPGEPGRYTSVKTGVEVIFPILPALKASIDAAPTGDLAFLVTEHGVPFKSAASFGNWFREQCKLAKSPAAPTACARPAPPFRPKTAPATSNSWPCLAGPTPARPASTPGKHARPSSLKAPPRSSEWDRTGTVYPRTLKKKYSNFNELPGRSGAL